jgi:hypothetical protein
MKKIAGILMFVMIGSIAFPCDYCNCYLGLNPQYKKNTFGIRYHYMNYTGTHESESELQEMGLSKDDIWETRTRVELHGQWYATPKMKIIFSAPYIINNEGIQAVESNSSHTSADEAMKGGTKTIYGIGDPIAIVHYQVFNSGGDSLHFNQRLFAGGGIKFPVGKWKLVEGEEPHERVHQPGTGSWDYMISAEYLAKFKRKGMNVNASYMIPTTNSQSYRFANRFNASMIYYYQVNTKATSVYPSLGAYYEQAGKDTDNTEPIENSGGTILFGHAGIDFYFRNFSINTAFQLPILQHLNEPQPEMKYRCMAGITYSFN